MKKRISLSSELRLSSDSLRSTQDTPRIVPVVPIELPPFIERKKPLRYTVEVEKINHYLMRIAAVVFTYINPEKLGRALGDLIYIIIKAIINALLKRS